MVIGLLECYLWLQITVSVSVSTNYRALNQTLRLLCLHQTLLGHNSQHWTLFCSHWVVAGYHFTTNSWLMSASQCVLVSSTHLGPKTRFILLFDVEHTHMRTICCLQLLLAFAGVVILIPVESCSYFVSWILIKCLWWPLFCLFLTQPHWAVMICWNIVASILNMLRN
jgi:hypothetical protein